MEKKIIWSPEAILSLQATFNYLEAEWSSKIAESYCDETQSRLDLICYYPEIGIESLSIPSWRKILITEHNILVYKMDKNKITLLNIIDTRSSAYTI